MHDFSGMEGRKTKNFRLKLTFISNFIFQRLTPPPPVSFTICMDLKDLMMHVTLFNKCVLGEILTN